jgi:hypothetical protein
MRDFRDAKTMAKTMRADLAHDDIHITHARSLELVAKAFGLADWNTLSAKISGPEKPAADDDPRPYFSEALKETLPRAGRMAAKAGHEATTLEDLMLALLDDPDAAILLEAQAIDVARLRSDLEAELAKRPSQAVEDGMTVTWPDAAFRRVVQRAVLRLKGTGRRQVNGADLLSAIEPEAETFAARRLSELDFYR